MALSLRRALQAARQAPSFAPALQAALQRGYAAGPVGSCAGIPEAIYDRKVVIYCPARTASQQGKALMGTWKIAFGEGERWENPLMGWTSTADPLAHVGRSALEFESAAAATAYAERQGWSYQLVQPQAALQLGSSCIKGAGKRGRVKQYGDNFSVLRRGTPIWEAAQSDPNK